LVVPQAVPSKDCDKRLKRTAADPAFKRGRGPAISRR
jgi:hypothetical protein